jgi:hypothetical protein
MVLNFPSTKFRALSMGFGPRHCLSKALFEEPDLAARGHCSTRQLSHVLERQHLDLHRDPRVSEIRTSDSTLPGD